MENGEDLRTMLRDKNLIPLITPAPARPGTLCADRAGISHCGEDLAPWQDEMAHLFQGRDRVHFAAEEADSFPGG